MFSTQPLRNIGRDGERFKQIEKLKSAASFKHQTYQVYNPSANEIFFIKDIASISVALDEPAEIALKQKRIAAAEVAAQNFLHHCLPDTQPAYQIVMIGSRTFVMSNAVPEFSGGLVNGKFNGLMKESVNLKLFGELSVLCLFLGELDYKTGNIGSGLFGQQRKILKIDGDYSLGDYTRRSEINMNLDDVISGSRYLPYPAGTSPYNWVGYKSEGLLLAPDSDEALIFNQAMVFNEHVRLGVLSGFEKILTKDKPYFLQLCQQAIGSDNPFANEEVNNLMRILIERQVLIKAGLQRYCEAHQLQDYQLQAYPAVFQIMKARHAYPPATKPLCPGQPGLMQARTALLFAGQKQDAVAVAVRRIRSVKAANVFTAPGSSSSPEEDGKKVEKRESDREPFNNRPKKK